MYAPFFGLQQEPFSIAPDPRYLFMSDRHREALAHLLYGVDGGGGFVLLTGEIGAGKTTVCRCFLEQIPPRCNVAYIFNPKLTVIELLQSVCEEFRVPVLPLEGESRGLATVKHYLDPLNLFLLKSHAAGQNNVLIIDEAQNLSSRVLEQLRLLTNLETSERKLLQIILIGQPELRTLLARPQLEQLAQRVIARYHLDALSEAETEQYVRHRLGVAGMTRAMPFTARALRRIHRLSRGVPRRINLLCDRALLGAYAGGSDSVDVRIVDRAAAEVFGTPADAAPRLARRGGAMAAMVAMAGIAAIGALAATVAAAGWMSRTPRAAVQSAAAPASAAVSTASAPASAAMAMGAASAVSVAAAASAASAAVMASALPEPMRDERNALRELAAAWKLTPGDGDPCIVAARQQLQCYRATVSLAVVRQLNRPALLTLRDERQRSGFVLLTGLHGNAATLQTGGASQRVPLELLARAWRGEIVTYWRSPPGYPANAAEGAAGPLVDWLDTQLTPQRAGTDASADLKSRVFAFQVAQGLRPDGIAGPTTFMQLNRTLGIDEPRLQP